MDIFPLFYMLRLVLFAALGTLISYTALRALCHIWGIYFICRTFSSSFRLGHLYYVSLSVPFSTSGTFIFYAALRVLPRACNIYFMCCTWSSSPWLVHLFYVSFL